jgi:hypothetical protein
LTDDGSITLALVEAAGAPHFETDVTDLLTQSLSSPVTATTFGDVRDRLSELLGDDETGNRLLEWIGLAGQPPTDAEPGTDPDQAVAALEALDNSDAQAMVRMLRRWRPRFAVALNDAFVMWLENPEDWSQVRTDPVYSYASQLVTINVGITKYSGEELTLEVSPTSLANLVAHFTSTLGRLPRPESSMDPESADRLLLAAAEFAETFAPAEGVTEDGTDTAEPGGNGATS